MWVNVSMVTSVIVFNERLSNFNILSAGFRHGKSSKDKMELHRMAVDCVAFLVHHDLKYHPLMDV